MAGLGPNRPRTGPADTVWREAATHPRLSIRTHRLTSVCSAQLHISVGGNMDSLILQTVIGLIFIFAVLSALVSVLTEAVTRFIGLRGEYLMRGIRSLVDKKS